jgi:hypothetical protein
MSAVTRPGKCNPITRPGKAAALHLLTVVQINKPGCEAIITNGEFRALAVTLAVRRNAADYLRAAKNRGTEMTDKTGIASGFCLAEI